MLIKKEKIEDIIPSVKDTLLASQHIMKAGVEI